MVSEAGAPASTADGTPAWPRFAVVDRSTLPEEIADRLLDLIKAEQLRPGDKLPAERELAAEMHVSRPVLREALRALAIMNVVEIRQGAGTYITALEPQALVSHLEFVFSKDPVALSQVIETRRIVETGNVRLAAQRITPDEVAELAALIRQLRAAVDDAERFAQLDIAFHDAVAAAAGNFLLVQFMRIINTLAKVSRERTGAAAATRKQALRDHEAILTALRAHDAAAAASAMEAHLAHVEAALATAMAPAASPARARAGTRVSSAASTAPAPPATPPARAPRR